MMAPDLGTGRLLQYLAVQVLTSHSEWVLAASECIIGLSCASYTAQQTAARRCKLAFVDFGPAKMALQWLTDSVASMWGGEGEASASQNAAASASIPDEQNLQESGMLTKVLHAWRHIAPSSAAAVVL